MKSAIIVQARMSSKRFPGKVLTRFAGKELIGYLLERLEGCRLDSEIVVATSNEASDDAIDAYCEKKGFHCFRGDLENVALRFLRLAEARRLDFMTRISADSPLLDPELVERANAIFLTGEHDIVCNVHPRSFPRGQSVEVIRTTALKRLLKTCGDAAFLEHVTAYLYAHPETFHIMNFRAPIDASAEQLSIDTREDGEVFERLLSAMTRPPKTYAWREILEIKRGL